MTPAVEDRYLALKAVMMPRDTNPWGTIFGGVTLSYIDQAAFVGAMHEVRRNGWPEQPLVTVAMNAVEFHEPLGVGDVVSFYTRIVHVGRSSITVHVVVESEHKDETVTLTQAEVTLVAVDLDSETRKSVPIRGN